VSATLFNRFPTRLSFERECGGFWKCSTPSGKLTVIIFLAPEYFLIVCFAHFFRPVRSTIVLPNIDFVYKLLLMISKNEQCSEKEQKKTAAEPR
jgi:hypothetical protein